MKQPTGLTRRQFIQITASAGLLVAGGAGFGLANRETGTVRVEETRLLLGSIANLTIITSKPDRAKAAIRGAFAKMAELEDVFSRFRPGSQLSQLNATGALADPHPALRTVLNKAIDYGDLTSGAFDVTVEPVLRLYRDAVQSGVWPSDDLLNAARRLVDYRAIDLSPSRVRLQTPGMAVTLDGIAKGFIIDAGTDVLREHGFDQVMVELGGDLQTSGGAGARPWQVLIQQPDGDTGEPLVAQLQDRAMATSGDYQYTFTADRRLHHILNPESGLSPGELASASVIAPTACDADALSTALLVMGSRAGLACINQLPGTEALVISKQGAITATADFPV